jgi:hypothetical protein
MGKNRRYGGIGAAVLAISALLTQPVAALNKEAPQAIRVTSGAPHTHPSTRSWGWYLAFVSSVDLTGEGSVGPQVYVFDLLNYSCQFGRPDLRPATQVPLFPTCPTTPTPFLVRATAGNPGDQISNPSVNSTGEVVAFEARGSFNNTFSGPAANRRQIFMRNLKTGVIHPVTGNPDGDSTLPSLNDTGGTLTFQSTANLLGTPTGISQVYMYTVPQSVAPGGTGTGALVVITRGMGNSTRPMLNKIGTHVVFQSTANLRGNGTDTGISQIFIYDRGSEKIVQLTDGNADSRNPYVEEKRPGALFFESDATDLPGTAGGPGTQIYRVTVQEGDLPVIEQFTFGPGNARWPAADPNGSRLLFVADGDLLQNGTTGNRLFALDYKTPVWGIYQITGRGNIDGPIGASLGLWFASFTSDVDVSGDGICGRQLYIVDYDPDHYIVAGKQRSVATQIGQLLGEPFPGNANDSCGDGDGCTSDVCQGGNTCTHSQLPENSQCAPGDVCTGVPTCQAGQCVATLGLDCDDHSACTDDLCDPDTGCQHTDKDCADTNPCTVDSCVAVAGCVHDPLPSFDGLTCQNGQVGQSVPQNLAKKPSKKIRKAGNMLSNARSKKPKRASKLLARAAVLLEAAAADAAIDTNLSRQEASALVAAIDELLAQIATVVDQLQAAGRGAR